MLIRLFSTSNHHNSDNVEQLCGYGSISIRAAQAANFCEDKPGYLPKTNKHIQYHASTSRCQVIFELESGWNDLVRKVLRRGEGLPEGLCSIPAWGRG
jgi:hypothetical protein